MPELKIHFKSDLHLEYMFKSTQEGGDERGLLQHPDDCDVIVLAGDIGDRKQLQNILRIWGACDKPVIYVPGNHEYYGSIMNSHYSEYDEDCREAFAGTSVHFLNPGHIVIKDVVFIGTTLWTPLNSAVDIGRVNSGGVPADFTQIIEDTSAAWKDRHYWQKSYLQKMLTHPDYEGM